MMRGMRKSLSIAAFLLATVGLGWGLLFCAGVGYRVYTDGLQVVEQVEMPYRIRALVAGMLGLLFLCLGLMLRAPNKHRGDRSP